MCSWKTESSSMPSTIVFEGYSVARFPGLFCPFSIVIKSSSLWARFYHLEKGKPLVYNHAYHETNTIQEGEYEISGKTGKVTDSFFWRCILHPQRSYYHLHNTIIWPAIPCGFPSKTLAVDNRVLTEWMFNRPTKGAMHRQQKSLSCWNGVYSAQFLARGSAYGRMIAITTSP